jgi:hypothetical protein
VQFSATSRPAPERSRITNRQPGPLLYCRLYVDDDLEAAVDHATHLEWWCARVPRAGVPRSFRILTRCPRDAGAPSYSLRYPPAIAPITRNGSAPDATASGNGASVGS